MLDTTSIQKIYESANGSLEAITTFMEKISAYSDFPFYKKVHLLCKIMERLGHWKVMENSNFYKIPPMDYHLMNMAWKLEMINLPSLTEEKITNYELLPSEHEFLIRHLCANAYRKLASYSGLDPYKIDDIMWMESRRRCQEEPYNCNACHFNPICRKLKTGFPLVETIRY